MDSYSELFAKFLIILIIFYTLYYICKYIYALLICGCSKHGRFLVQEGFANSDFNGSKAYFESLSKRCTGVQTKIENLTGQIDELTSGFDNLQSDICYISKQVDNSLAGNYASNIGPDESAYSADEQKQRALTRQADSLKYVKNLKAIYVKNHDNVPLVECFSSSMNEDESAKLEVIRDKLDSQLSTTEESLEQLNISLDMLQKNYNKDLLDMYYTTLKYNDTYLKKAAKVLSEGFVNPEDDNSNDKVFDFKATPKTANSESNPGIRISKIESNYELTEAKFNKINTNFVKFLNTTKQQKSYIDGAKDITTNTDTQKTLITANVNNVIKG